ncbi:MAG TPA: PIG-L family deacetylase, partial [Candidatus Limnocylindrales bacterium]|nr:PIG-L family deacetylase [Candidatus Limnocylindrales bacterium]
VRILVIGAHADDIEIGCGGTLLRLVEEGRIGAIRWLVLSAAGDRIAEARAGAAAFTGGVQDVQVEIGDARDGFFPAEYGAIKERFERLKSWPAPDLVLVPRRDDLHQDHRIVAEMTWTTFRDHLILEYEIPKWDADLAPPNAYVELTAEIVERKASLLAQTFGSQADRDWFSRETFVGLARVRGIECRAAGGYAEAFHARKMVLGAASGA